jgi:hypothetical protein
MDITWVPDAVFHVIITFAESSLSQILALQRVNRHFRRMMRLPIMASHLDLRGIHVGECIPSRAGTTRVAT